MPQSSQSSTSNLIYLKRDIDVALTNLMHQVELMLSARSEYILTEDDLNVSINLPLKSLFNLRFEHPLERTLYEVIVHHCILAEKMCPGCFLLAMRKIVSFIHGNKIPEQMTSISSRIATLSDIERLVFNVVDKSDKSLGNMLRSATTLAGFGGRIILEKTDACVSSVELLSGYVFEVNPGWEMTCRFDNVRTIVIDGFIDSVSEIHHLLTSASETHETYILFSRGMSADVLHTLRVNYDRGLVRVVPIIVNFDLEGINAVNDIAIVTASNLVSSQKGELISSIKFETVPIVDKVFVYPNKIVVQNTANVRAVQAQIAMLMKKRSDVHVVDDVCKLYDKRIRSLSASQVIIRLQDDAHVVRNTQILDNALRMIATIVDKGVVEIDGDLCATTSVMATNLFVRQCIEMLQSLGACVI